MNKILSLILLLSGSLAGATFFSVSITRFEARNTNEAVNVYWQVNDEQSVREYILERKTRYDIGFREVKRQGAEGTNRTYQYTDQDLYKDTVSNPEQVQYRLRVLEKDGTVVTSGVLNINYYPTAIRRTWGSIKAMFQ